MKKMVSKKPLCFVILWYQFSMKLITRENWVQQWFDLTSWAEYKTSTGQKNMSTSSQIQSDREAFPRSYSSLDAEQCLACIWVPASSGNGSQRLTERQIRGPAQRALPRACEGILLFAVDVIRKTHSHGIKPLLNSIIAVFVHCTGPAAK